MTQFDDRERAFENKFARDQETQFRIIARRNRLLGLWAAKKMGLTDAEADAYAKEVIRADFEDAGEEEVIRKLLGDLISAGVEIDEAAIRATLEHIAIIRRLRSEGGEIAAIARATGLSRPTIYRILAEDCNASSGFSDGGSVSRVVCGTAAV